MISKTETDTRRFVIDYCTNYDWATAQSACAKDLGDDKVEVSIIFKRTRTVTNQGPVERGGEG